MALHPLVEDVVATYLQVVDIEAPGLVEGLYLTGSAVLGDFQPDSSDIDFVAVTSTPPGMRALVALRHAHDRLRRLCPRPFFDGLYVTWGDLVRDPAVAGASPHAHEGRFSSRGGRADPVTWHTVGRYGVTCRGPRPADLGVWTDPKALVTWTADNLDTYWRPWLARSLRLTRPPGLFALTPYAAVWAVSGVSRIHYTIATGDICSKQAACDHALGTFPPRWSRVATEALRLRRGGRASPGMVRATASAWTDHFRLGTAEAERSLYPNPFARRRDVLAFVQTAIDDAQRLAA